MVVDVSDRQIINKRDRAQVCFASSPPSPKSAAFRKYSLLPQQQLKTGTVIRSLVQCWCCRHSVVCAVWMCTPIWFPSSLHTKKTYLFFIKQFFHPSRFHIPPPRHRLVPWAGKTVGHASAFDRLLGYFANFLLIIRLLKIVNCCNRLRHTYTRQRPPLNVKSTDLTSFSLIFLGTVDCYSSSFFQLNSNYQFESSSKHINECCRLHKLKTLSFTA